MRKQKYQCCFCGNVIDTEKFNITGLTVTSNWEKEFDLQKEQQLFCHITCLKERLLTQIPLYIMEID